MNEARIKAVMSGQARGVAPACLRAATSLIEPAYRFAVTRRNRRFDQGQGVVTLARPVISVGNLTTGGTGKTPFVTWLAMHLLERGQRPAILLRGYGSDDPNDSDEAREYRQRLGERVPVMPNPDRVVGAQAVLDAQPDVTHFLLDDGFQHRRVARDVNLVLIDATNPFGFDHVLPRGLLREPLSSLKRASAVVLTRCDRVDESRLQSIEATIAQHHGQPPLARTRHAWVSSTGSLTLEQLAEQPVTVALGLGNPNAFVAELEHRQITINRQVIMPDHHAWSTHDVQQLTALGDPVVTSLKDWVKLQKLWLPQHPVCVPEVGIDFLQGHDALVKAIPV